MRTTGLAKSHLRGSPSSRENVDGPEESVTLPVPGRRKRSKTVAPAAPERQNPEETQSGGHPDKHHWKIIPPASLWRDDGGESGEAD